MRRRPHRIDFVKCINSDVAISIFTLLEDPADLVRVAAVSRSWRHFVITNDLCKSLCLRKAPQIANISNVVEEQDAALVMYGNQWYTCWEAQVRDHRLYSSLSHMLLKSPILPPKNCMECIIGASSTDPHQGQSILHALLPYDVYNWGFSYWSSKGKSDPNAPEKITFKLIGTVCIVTEIKIRPFEEYWKPGQPTYSAKSVRFLMGHPRSYTDLVVDRDNLPLPQLDDDRYIWTYTSPDFPMDQESSLQSFKLPQPVLCVGGFLQIELLGRAQSDEHDRLYYLRLGGIEILGQPINPAFEIKMGPPGNLTLIYRADAVAVVLHRFSLADPETDEEWWRPLVYGILPPQMPLGEPLLWEWEDYDASGDEELNG